MIFGDNEITSQQPDRKMSFTTKKADAPEESLLSKERDKKQSDSDNSDDYLFGNNDGKWIRNSEIRVVIVTGILFFSIVRGGPKRLGTENSLGALGV